MGWVQQLFTRRRRYDELSQSIQEHLEEKIADLVDSDMPREEAERTARREFGNVTLVEQHSREVWQWPTLESILADLRFALRQFRKAPGFAVTAILVVALGIAASVTIFTFVNAALLKPLPYQAPSRLVAVFEHTTDCPECAISYPDYQDWKSANTVFQSFEIWEADHYLWRNSAGVESLRAGRVSGGFFQTLGVTPMLGRLFTAADDSPGAARAVVLPYGTWQRRFGGRADILGQSITLDDNAYTVIGVLRRDFQFARVRLNSGSRSTTLVTAKPTVSAAHFPVSPASKMVSPYPPRLPTQARSPLSCKSSFRSRTRGRAHSSFL